MCTLDLRMHLPPFASLLEPISDSEGAPAVDELLELLLVHS